MAISLDKNRKSSHTFTLDELGTYVFNEVKCESNSKVAYKFRISTWFDKYDPENRRVKVRFNSRLYSDEYSAFALYNVYTKVFVDEAQKASKTITELDENSSVLGATWNDYLEYDENGQLSAVVKATLSCSASGIHPPKKATVQISITFPEIGKLKNPSLKIHNDSKYVDAIANVRVDGEWKEKKAVAHVYSNGEWKKGV